MKAIKWLTAFPAKVVVGMVRLYQLTLSHLLGRQCRFYPSCSNYCMQAVRKYGVVSGLIRSVTRVLKCHPFHPGGYDPP